MHTYVYVSGGLEMLVFRKILRTYLMDDPFWQIDVLKLNQNLGKTPTKDYVIEIRFQIKLTIISAIKGWSDQEVNTLIDKDLNP